MARVEGTWSLEPINRICRGKFNKRQFKYKAMIKVNKTVRFKPSKMRKAESMEIMKKRKLSFYLINYLYQLFLHVNFINLTIADKDKTNYLWRNANWTPFEYIIDNFSRLSKRQKYIDRHHFLALLVFSLIDHVIEQDRI